MRVASFCEHITARLWSAFRTHPAAVHILATANISYYFNERERNICIQTSGTHIRTNEVAVVWPTTSVGGQRSVL